MPVLRSREETGAPISDTAAAAVLLDRGHTGSDHCEVRRLSIPAGADYSFGTGADDLAWFMVLSGSGTLGAAPIDASTVCLAMPGTDIRIAARDGLDILFTLVPRATRFDPDLAAQDPGIRIVDWTREPVLQSEHDTRTRIYLTTPGLVGTGAIKAERIAYPPGATSPAHHHEGAEHFQFVLAGEGTVVLDGREQALGPGDILYNFENELHYFLTDPAAEETFEFVEFFIPGHCRTVWAPGGSACAWLPTGLSASGEPPVREIGHHVHGDDRGI